MQANEAELEAGLAYLQSLTKRLPVISIEEALTEATPEEANAIGVLFHMTLGDPQYGNPMFEKRFHDMAVTFLLGVYYGQRGKARIELGGEVLQ